MAKKAETVEEWAAQVSGSGKAILVEGESDERALRALGIKNRIYSLRRRPLYAVVESIAEKERDLILLTDLDKEGKRLYGTLSSSLQRFGVRIDNKAREWLLRNTKVRQIEGLRL